MVDDLRRYAASTRSQHKTHTHYNTSHSYAPSQPPRARENRGRCSTERARSAGTAAYASEAAPSFGERGREEKIAFFWVIFFFAACGIPKATQVAGSARGSSEDQILHRLLLCLDQILHRMKNPLLSLSLSLRDLLIGHSILMPPISSHCNCNFILSFFSPSTTGTATPPSGRRHRVGERLRLRRIYPPPLTTRR